MPTPRLPALCYNWLHQQCRGALATREATHTEHDGCLRHTKHSTEQPLKGVHRIRLRTKETCALFAILGCAGKTYAFCLDSNVHQGGTSSSRWYEIHARCTRLDTRHSRRCVSANTRGYTACRTNNTPSDLCDSPRKRHRFLTSLACRYDHFATQSGAQATQEKHI